jgi:transposase
LLLRIVLIGYLYGIPSERKLVEELRMHLAGRWFTGLGFDRDPASLHVFEKPHGQLPIESGLLELSAWYP